MMFLKSILVGILSVILTALSLLIAAFLYSRTSDFAIGWDPRGLRSVSFWIVVAVIFALVTRGNTAGCPNELQTEALAAPSAP
jgi:VIT1/CCC1 family predicted Fe2+/Mn2+ transporter